MTSTRRRGAKIVATLGPASTDPGTIRAMVEAGLDVARLNFSHGDHGTLATFVSAVRAAQAATGKPIAIMGDLQGPKIRIGELAEPLVLAPGFPLRIDINAGTSVPPHAGEYSDTATVSCDYPRLAEDLGPNDRIFLRDGLIELEVMRITGSIVETVVRSHGTLTSRAGMHVPGVVLQLPALTDKDREDIRFARDQRLDYLALSFVRRAEDIREARAFLTAPGAGLGLIAKIETAAALDDLEAIASEADGVMVARGDLGVELGAENVPILQRRIIQESAEQLAPVIVATQMLESMVENARPTRAEASDVANAVWDGADAVMLSAETAVGAYPVESVEMMDRIVRRAESTQDARVAPTFEQAWQGDSSRSVSWATRAIVEQNPAVGAVIAFTMGGYTARLIAKDRMRVPVLVLAPDPAVEQRAALLWGVEPVPCPPPSDLETMLATVDTLAKERLGCADGDSVVVVGGIPLGQGKPTNFLKVHTIGEAL